MTWAKVDDRTHEDPRSEAASVEAMGLWVLALSYMAAHSTDGRITLERCRRLVGAQKGKRLADRLVAAGWWEVESEDAYRLVDWERALLPRAETEDRSARAAVTGRKGGEARAARAPKVEPRSGVRSVGSLPPSTPPCDEASSGNSAERKETALPTPAPDPDPTRPDPVSAHTREGDPLQQGETLDLFGRSGRSAPGSSSPEPQGRSRRAPKQKAARAEDTYADAFAAGSKDAGYPLTPLLPNERGLLGPIAATHARYRDDTPITGEALPVWFRHRARAFRIALTAMPFHRGGGSVLGFRNWLDEGAEGEERPLAPGQEETPEDDTDAQLIELMKAEDAAKEAARGPRPPPSQAAREAARRLVYRFAGKPLPEDAPKVAADG